MHAEKPSDRECREAWRLAVLKEKFARRIESLFRVLFPFLFWRPISPNLLTVAGSLLAAAAAVAFFRGEFLVAGLLVLASGFFDLADGAVARHFDLTTRFGAFLDSTLDRLADILIFLGLTLHYATHDRLALALLTAYALVMSLLTSYTKARAEAFLAEFKVGFFERGERIGVLALGAIAQPFVTMLNALTLALGVLAVCGTITVVQRVWVAKNALANLDRDARRASQQKSVESSRNSGLHKKE